MLKRICEFLRLAPTQEPPIVETVKEVPVEDMEYSQLVQKMANQLEGLVGPSVYWARQSGSSKAHVGDIINEDVALAVAEKVRKSGFKAHVQRSPKAFRYTVVIELGDKK